MPDGQLRRPPQLWEQRLSRTTSILGVGISSSGDATAIVPPTPPPGAGGGTEPAPVTPPAGVFKKPSTPSLIGAVQGINVLWDGLNADGDLWPYDTSFVEVHMDTSGTAFTPGTATLKGRLARPGGLYVGGLTAGTTYYFRLRGADPAGNYTEASNAASGQTGLTTSSDYGTATIGSGAVSFDARAIGGITTTVGTATPSSPREGDIWLDTSGGNTTHKRYTSGVWQTQAWSTSSIGANVITATQIAAGAVTAGAIAAGAITAEKIQAGAVTADKLTAGTITGFYISGATINGGLVSGGTVTGASITTSAFNPRVALNDGGGRAAYLDIFSSNNAQHSIYGDLGDLVISPSSRLKVGSSVQIQGDLSFVGSGNGDITATSIDTSTVELGTSGSNRAFRINSSGEVFSYGIDGTTTASAANIRVEQTGSRQLVRSTSTERVKTEIVAVRGHLEAVTPGKISAEPASVDPWDVLNIAPAEFQSLAPVDQNQRLLGFIAENVAAAFPWAAEWDEDGLPSSVADRPILAALLAVVKDQAATIEDLRARIEALEA